MTRDKYGAAGDRYCYPQSQTLRNLLDLRDDAALANAERDLTAEAASALEFQIPPYDLGYVSAIHRHLFARVYSWAGELRTVDISKGNTRFCTVSRIGPESAKIFAAMARLHWFEGMDRGDLVTHVAESFGDFNVIHPFREGNGRVQRIVFEQLIINAGYEIGWVDVEPDSWVNANVAAYGGDYAPLVTIFDACIGRPIQDADF